MRVRIDHPGQNQHARRIDDLLASAHTLANLGDLVGADENVRFPLAIGGDHRSAADQHVVTPLTRDQTPISYRWPGSRSRPLTTCQSAATAFIALRRSKGARSL